MQLNAQSLVVWRFITTGHRCQHLMNRATTVGNNNGCSLPKCVSPIQLKPNHANAYYNRGLSYDNKGAVITPKN